MALFYIFVHFPTCLTPQKKRDRKDDKNVLLSKTVLVLGHQTSQPGPPWDPVCGPVNLAFRMSKVMLFYPHILGPCKQNTKPRYSFDGVYCASKCALRIFLWCSDLEVVPRCPQVSTALSAFHFTK